MGATLFAVNKGYLDDIDVKKALAFEHGLHQHLKSSHAACWPSRSGAKATSPKKDSKRRQEAFKKTCIDAEAELTAAIAAPSRRASPKRLTRSRLPWQSAKRSAAKIKSVENTQEDHQGHGNGRRVQDAQGAGAHAPARPYADKIRNIAANLSQANPEYRHPFMRRAARRKRWASSSSRPTRACAAA
jgi:hypothetical protein